MAINIFQTIKKKPFQPQVSTNSGVYTYNTKGNTAGNVGSTYQTILPKTNTTKIQAPYSDKATSPYGMSTNKGYVNYNITPSQPKVPPPKVEPSQPQVDFNTRYQNYLTGTAQRKSDLAKRAYEEEVKSANELGATTEAGLGEDIRSMEDYFGKYSKGQLERAEKRKEAARTEQGAGQRRLAETRRQQKAQTEKQYAALGTIDSYGTGSFTQANENIENEFSRLSAESQANLENKLYQIDSDTEDKIAKEEANFNSEVRRIKQLLAGNTVAQNQAIRQAFIKYQGNISDIESEREGLKLQAEQEELKYQRENTPPNLSDQFLEGGKPTMNDVFILSKYPNYAKTYETFFGSKKQKKTESQTKLQAAVDGAQYALTLLNTGEAQTGPFTNAFGKAKRELGLYSPKQQDFLGTLALAKGQLLSALSGANVPPSEYNRLASLLEIENSDPQVAKQQLNTFIRELQRFTNSEVNMGGQGLTQEMISQLNQFNQ